MYPILRVGLLLQYLEELTNGYQIVCQYLLLNRDFESTDIKHSFYFFYDKENVKLFTVGTSIHRRSSARIGRMFDIDV